MIRKVCLSLSHFLGLKKLQKRLQEDESISVEPHPICVFLVLLSPAELQELPACALALAVPGAAGTDPRRPPWV